MKDIFKKNKIVFIAGFILIIIIVLVLYFIFKNKVEYKAVIDYEVFDKNSDEAYNKYNKKVDENRFEIAKDNDSEEIKVSYNEIKDFEQVNVVVNYDNKELTRFESLSPVTNVIKYKELFLIFIKENSNNRESVIVLNEHGDKLIEIIASDERDNIEISDDMIINKKYITDKEYKEVDENTGTECGKKEIYRLTDNGVFLDNYEYIYCLIEE